MTLMLVDDSATMRKITALALKTESYDCVEAENGQDALSKLSAQKIDFFIVDVNMPVMNGFEFVKELRNIMNYKDTPVVFLTTETEQDMVSKGKAAGANAWIAKPFKNEELIQLVKKLAK